MKNLVFLCLFFALLLLGRTSRAQSVGIGTASPNAKAVLDLSSSTQGLLIPRLTAAQRGAIAAPPQGLMVYQTDGSATGGSQTGFWYYAGSGGWVLVNPTGAADNLGNHTATQNLNLGPNLLVGNGGTTGLQMQAAGEAKIGADAWSTAADDRRLKFGDQNFVTIGETGGDDLLQLRAKDFRFDRSSGGGSYTGFVGIGPATAAPLTRLSLSPSAVEPKITLFDNGSATDHYGFGISSGQLNYHVGSTADNHVFYGGGKNGDGTELARLTGAGRLGVGTSAPFSMLANTAANIVGADGFGVGSKSLAWSSNLAGYAAAVFNANAGAGQNGLAVKVAGANAAATAFDVSQGPAAGTAGASLLAVQANGYVGLGTPNPNATLEVRRGLAPDGTAAFWGTARVSHFNYGTAENTYIRGGKVTSNVYLNDDGSGNVGIGSSAAPERLSVAGTVRADVSNGSNAALIGANASTGGFAVGVRGTAAGSGYGVRGTAGTNGYGVSGSADGPTGRGVDGFALDGYGVYAETESGTAVRAVVSNTGANNGYAVTAQATDGVGVRAIATTGQALWATANGTGPAATITQNGTGLALDVTGGAIRTTEVKTPAAGRANMLALAYGNISASGAVRAGSSDNVAIRRLSVGNYSIAIAGETLTDAGYFIMVQLTGVYTGEPLYFQATSGRLLVQVNGGIGGTLSDASFNFIIYKP